MTTGDLDQERARARLLDAALPHVAFDGWSEASFAAAAAECGMDMGLARVICPRGAVDLAVAYHRSGDAAMLARIEGGGLDGLRYRDKVATLLRWRLEAADREVVRRGAALFALPHHAATGAGLIWGTADAIWRALGDTSDDINWYSKRAILSGVWSAAVLYWLGDQSPGQAATHDFIDRRIEDVMRFETFKAKVRDNRPLMQLLSGPLWLAAQIKAPRGRPDDLPGRTGRRGAR